MIAIPLVSPTCVVLMGASGVGVGKWQMVVEYMYRTSVPDVLANRNPEAVNHEDGVQ
jgi:hypothetical protein